MSHRVEKDVMAPLRDGQTLATDLWVPDGGLAPTLLTETRTRSRLPVGEG